MKILKNELFFYVKYTIYTKRRYNNRYLRYEVQKLMSVIAHPLTVTHLC